MSSHNQIVKVPAIDWLGFITSVIANMRANANDNAKAMDASALIELRELRTLSFRAGRQNGKSSAIIEYITHNDDCLFYDPVTQALYSGVDENGERVIKKVYSDVDVITAMKVVEGLGVKTFFTNAVSKKVLDYIQRFYCDNRDKMSSDFILVVEE